MKERTKWTEEKFKTELVAICNGIGRFPSNTELRDKGRNDLSCQIVKRGGFVHWSKELGFDRKRSDSDVGWEGEGAVLDLLAKRGFSCEARKTMRCPYDILVSGVVRIDVKTAKFATYGRSSGKGTCEGWHYRIGKDAQSDVVLLYQSDTTDCYLIPWNKCPSSNITITPTGETYAKYKNNFALLEKLVRSRSVEEFFDIIP